jgi:hypothetical protein
MPIPQRPTEAAAPMRRKPYQAPAIEQSGSFERVVLSCTHTPAEASADPDCFFSQCSTNCGGTAESA